MKITRKQPEVWLRGPVAGIPALLQPAAHALLQTAEELPYWLQDFEETLLWEKRAGRASVGFHLQHLTGVLDRMLTYASGKKLTDAQFLALKAEGVKDADLNTEILIAAFNAKVAEALSYFKSLKEDQLTETRSVGRKELPATVIGLLFHAAEHSQRHLGQLLVTISFITNEI